MTASGRRGYHPDNAAGCLVHLFWMVVFIVVTVGTVDALVSIIF